MTTFGNKQGNKTIKLNDTAGTDNLLVKDADGFSVFKVDSKGNVKAKGTISKI